MLLSLDIWHCFSDFVLNLNDKPAQPHRIRPALQALVCLVDCTKSGN